MAKYLSSEKLGLKDPTGARRKALIKTLKLLESGKVKHREFPSVFDENDNFVDFSRLKPIKNAFNMADYTYPCGTPACVAGWADHFLKEDGKRPFFVRMHVSDDTSALSNIFSGYFARPDQDLAQITPKQAAKALRKFLETGQ